MPQDATITSISIINSGISCSSPPSGFNSLLNPGAPGQYYIDLSRLPYYCPGVAPSAWQSGVDLAINISGTDVSASNVNTDGYALINGAGLKRLPSYFINGGSQPGNVQLVVPAALVPDNNAIYSSYVMLSMPQDATITSISIVNSGISCSSPPSGFNSLLNQTAQGQYYIDLSQLPSYCPGLTPVDWQSGVDLAINISGTDVSTSNVGADAYSYFVFGLKRSPVKVVQGNNSSSASPISMNIYAGTDYPNEPIVVVYINGQPVKLLLDTAATGVLVNQGTFPISQTAFTSQTFSSSYGDGTTISGTVAIATVCPTSSTVGCVTMPIAVNSQTSGTNVSFSSTGEEQGDFGMDCGYNIQFGPNAFCYLYYLWQQNPSYSSYSLSFNIPSNTFYYTPSATTPIGTITYGSFSASNLISYPPYGFTTNAVYGNSLTIATTFDTGGSTVTLSRSVLQAEIPNFSVSSDENGCNIPSEVQGGINLYYQIPYVNSNSMFSTTFTTEPTSNMCSVLSNNPLILEGWTIDVDTIGYNLMTSFEDIGLPEMVRHSYIWILGNNGMVQYVGIP